MKIIGVLNMQPRNIWKMQKCGMGIPGADQTEKYTT
jgi:hypothetical protein